MIDAWEDAHGDDGGETCDVPTNSYANPELLRNYPGGTRIDYVMYLAGENIKAETTECKLPLPSRVPNKEFSYSDHEAVCATIKLERTNAFKTVPEYRQDCSALTHGSNMIRK